MTRSSILRSIGRSSSVHLFVYGTLRKGNPLYPWIEDAVLFCYEDATTPGELFYHSMGSYPVANLTTQSDGIIYGDLLVLRGDHASVHATINMEKGAGYSVKPIKCQWRGKWYGAVAFHWPHPEKGEQILNGDWNRRHDQRGIGLVTGRYWHRGLERKNGTS